MVILRIESFFGTLLKRTGLDGLVRQLRGRKVPILMYHSIVPDSADPSACLSLAGMTLTESRFREHMAYVAAHYHTITLADYVMYRENGRELPAHPCIITFDDGFRDFFELANPVLADHGLTAVVFVIGSTLQPGGRGSWLHDLYSIIDMTPFLNCSRAMAKVVPDYAAKQIRSKAHLREWAGKRFAEFDSRAREELLRMLEADLKVDRRHPARFLNEAELRELRAEGFEIGAHTMHHELLANLDEASLHEEIVESRRVIESVLGSRPVAFCYPFGGFDSWDNKTVKKLREAGFSCAVSTVEGLNDARTDLFALKRIRVTGEIPASVLVFRMLGLRAFRWRLQEMRRNVRGNRR